MGSDRRMRERNWDGNHGNPVTTVTKVPQQQPELQNEVILRNLSLSTKQYSNNNFSRISFLLTVTPFLKVYNTQTPRWRLWLLCGGADLYLSDTQSSGARSTDRASPGKRVCGEEPDNIQSIKDPQWNVPRIASGSCLELRYQDWPLEPGLKVMFTGRSWWPDHPCNWARFRPKCPHEVIVLNHQCQDKCGFACRAIWSGRSQMDQTLALRTLNVYSLVRKEHEQVWEICWPMFLHRVTDLEIEQLHLQEEPVDVIRASLKDDTWIGDVLGRPTGKRLLGRPKTCWRLTHQLIAECSDPPE